MKINVAYGAFPKLIAKKLKISLAEAQEIFDGYHELYHEIDEYYDGYHKQAKTKGFIESAYYGHRLYINNLDKDTRTLNNFLIQSGSFILIERMDKLQRAIEEAGLTNAIRIVSSIYDAVYAYVVEEPEVVKWYNDNLVEIFSRDYKENQQIPLEIQLDIGHNWKKMETLNNKESLENIEKTMKGLYDQTKL